MCVQYFYGRPELLEAQWQEREDEKKKPKEKTAKKGKKGRKQKDAKGPEVNEATEKDEKKEAVEGQEPKPIRDDYPNFNLKWADFIPSEESSSFDLYEKEVELDWDC